ncbi:hypothetical protein [Luteimonas aestuarii]|uniref:hypothetical protein n=1 Tax=Luteimonas aestuarii TaxID=453837 RepID=UPI0014054FB9|nr:hypothetical protein [Luteimonas aestuarii]
MTDNHKPAPPHRDHAPLPPQRRSRLLRWGLLALLGLFAAILVVAVMQVFVGPSA